jgi:hypothetical protein
MAIRSASASTSTPLGFTNQRNGYQRHCGGFLFLKNFCTPSGCPTSSDTIYIDENKKLPTSEEEILPSQQLSR